MLKLIIPSAQFYDEKNNEFIYTKEHVLQLEHSLVSISKWESKWGKPFLSKNEQTFEESVDYIRCMTITQNVPPDIYKLITNDHINQVATYIAAPMTATTIRQNTGASNNEPITAEIIYYCMIAQNIPIEFQKWHLNRLITLINVCNIKNTPSKKMSKGELAERHRTLNETRKKALNTNG